MCKATHKRHIKQKNKLPNETPLDTIRNFCPPETKSEDSVSLKSFQKRQKAKAITKAMTSKLMAIESPLKNGYRRAYNCAEYLYQEGNKITSNYCKHRCCNVCNRIKSAKMFLAYKDELLSIENLYFVTLTTPNIKGSFLSEELDKMQGAWRKIYKNIKKNYKSLNLKGMYKLECTYNYRSKTYNPHYHLLISSKDAAEEIKRQWLNQFEKASNKAQDVRKANEGSLIELFKYVTKSVVNGNYSAIAMDTIYCSMANRNTYYPIGIKKQSEDIDELQSQVVEFKGEKIDVWKWCQDRKDWYTPNEEPFIGKKLSGKSYKIISVIDASEVNTNEVKTEIEIFNNRRKEKLLLDDLF